MKKFGIVLSVIFFSFSLIAQQKNNFFYYRGEKIYLEIDMSRSLIISEKVISENNIKDKLFNITQSRKSMTAQNVIAIDNIEDLVNNNEEFFTEISFPKENITQTDYFEIVRKIQEDSNVIQVSPSFLVNGKKLSLSNNFYVKLHNIEDVDKLSKMVDKHFIRILGRNEYMPLWITLSCTKQTPMNAIEAANLFYESQLFEYAEPEFLYHDLQTTNDAYYSDQWGLKNTGQLGGTPNVDIHAESAWTITAGSPNIRVAVFDHGFEMNHPDLVNSVYSTGYDANTGTSPATVRGDHGTACAGIIGAQQNNSIGVSGIAPNSKLISISINLNFSDTPQQLANGFNWAWQNGADVISNSWGGYTPSSIIDDAITATLAQGRNGKGTIVVFASGNENNTNIRYPGNSNPDILVVGAISNCGERKSYTSCDGESWWGSNYGSELDAVAPGVFIPTTDRQGDNGYNYNGMTDDYSNRDYTEWFNGTSSACPHVAGIAALILSVNPNLTQKQVSDIIESTTQKIGGYNYQTTSGRPNGAWNNEMGYGLVNAYAAVQAASCVTDFTNQTVTTNTVVVGCDNLNVQNVTVTNGAKLTLDAPGEVLINGQFEVTLGSELEIKP